ncbi:hypothetical protein HDV00_000976 [Rhizophlyctis rosea]|nr:hypothetical protein HDV00_000976 [Rhizophlyctis rosea]
MPGTRSSAKSNGKQSVEAASSEEVDQNALFTPRRSGRKKPANTDAVDTPPPAGEAPAAEEVTAESGNTPSHQSKSDQTVASTSTRRSGRNKSSKAEVADSSEATVEASPATTTVAEEADIISPTPTVPRRRGRPPKRPSPNEDVATTEASPATTTVTEEEKIQSPTPTVSRRRGRPPKRVSPVEDVAKANGSPIPPQTTADAVLTSETQETPTTRRNVRKRAADGPSATTDSPSAPTPSKAKRPRVDKTTVEYLLTNRGSQLAKEDTNLKALFSYEIFSSFSPEDQAELANLLSEVDTVPGSDASAPSLHQVETSTAHTDPMLLDDTASTSTPQASTRSIPPKFLKYNHNLEECIESFQELLGLGYYEPDQQELMLKDVEKTKMDYDAWKEEHFEEVWGEKLDPELTDAIAEAAKSIDLAELFRARVLVGGDVLRFRKRFVKKGILVEKDVKIMESDGSITVCCGKEVWKDVRAPTMIENLVLDFDGRLARGERPNGNAWKSISLIRKGKPVGPLAQLRNDYAIRKHAAGG